MAQKKIFEVEYVVDIKEKVLQKKKDIVMYNGRFWEHAIENPKFQYKLDTGDVNKAKAVATILKYQAKMGKMKRVKFKQLEVVS